MRGVGHQRCDLLDHWNRKKCFRKKREEIERKRERERGGDWEVFIKHRYIHYKAGGYIVASFLSSEVEFVGAEVHCPHRLKSFGLLTGNRELRTDYARMPQAQP